jgi:hypothetical protein
MCCKGFRRRKKRILGLMADAAKRCRFNERNFEGEKMSGFYHPMPREVLQDTDRFTCWAAALESWMSVTPESPLSWAIRTQDDAIREYEYFCDDAGGAGVLKGFRWFAAALGMRFESFKPAAGLSAAYVYEKLETKGYLYVFAVGQKALGNGQAHASVIYGISDDETEDCTVAVMDPWKSGIVPAKTFGEFQKAEEILIAWLEHAEIAAENQAA